MPNIVALCVVIPDTRGGAMISFVPFSYTGHSEVAAPSKYVDTAAIMRTDGASNIMLIISDQKYNRSYHNTRVLLWKIFFTVVLYNY